MKTFGGPHRGWRSGGGEVSRGSLLRRGSLLVALAASFLLGALPAYAASSTHSITIVTGGGPGGIGTADPLWTYSVGGASGSAVIMTPHPAYAPPISGSRWINTSGSSTVADLGCNTTVTYTATFTLPENFTAASISGSVHADNAAGVYVNGNLLVQQPQISTFANFQNPATPFASSSPAFFQSGTNTLVVTNLDLDCPNGIDLRADVTYQLRDSFTGFSSPIDMAGAVNTVNAGSAVPVKFSLVDGDGNQITDPSLVTITAELSSACSSAAVTDAIEVEAAGATALRYDSDAMQFVMNWKTPRTPGACLALTASAGDAEPITAYFLLK
jgi:hypothetical protein